jgi:hypothetical protein
MVQEESNKIYFVIFQHFYKFLRILEVLKQFLEFKTIEIKLKFDAQCWVKIGPRPATHSRPDGRLGHGLAARALCGAGGGALANGPVAASRRQGSQLEHPRHAMDASGKESGGGAHRGGRTTVGWRGVAGAAAF